ncbi:RNA polymerase sigma factor [Planctomycetota bacterium]
MGHPYWTDMGGIAGKFLTTHWSLLKDLKASEGDENRALAGQLLKQYWKPVYAYLRRMDYDNEQAKDLTQGFFHEVVLNRHLIERADSTKGSFRSLLLHALRQFLISEKRKETAAKRIPKDRLAQLDAIDPSMLPHVMDGLSPEDNFNNAWKIDLLQRVLAQVEADYVNAGRETHWYVFRDRLLWPLLQDHPVPSFKKLCEQYGIKKEDTASHMLTTVKRHFQTVLRDHVRQTVLTGNAIDGEFEEMVKFLNK